MSASTQRTDNKKNVPLIDKPESNSGKDETDPRFKSPKSYVYMVEMTGDNIAHEFGIEHTHERMRSFKVLDEAIEAIVITILEYSRYYWNIIDKLKLSRDPLRKDLAAYVMENRTSDGFFDDKKFGVNSSNSNSSNSNTNKFTGWHVNVYTIPVFEKARDYMPIIKD